MQCFLHKAANSVTYQLLDVCICFYGIFNFSIADWFIVVDGVTDYFVAIRFDNVFIYYSSILRLVKW